jgi:4-hydroxy-tetrahydrodipicolinate synthase
LRVNAGTLITGVIPAALTPFDDDGKVHTADLERHLEFVLRPDAVTAVTVNGHAGEVSSLTTEEQRHVLSVARSVVPAGQKLIAGVYAHSTTEAARSAEMAAGEGADALLVFPPEVFEFGLRESPWLSHDYHRAIAEASGLPLIAFVYPTSSPVHLGPAAILELCSDVPAIAAVKEWSNDIIGYERTLRGLRALDTAPTLLSSFSRALLPSLVVGADGILSGHGSLVPDVHSDLFEAVRREDLAEARRIADVLYALTDVFYTPPHIDAHSRMKVASEMLGRISSAYVRGPLQPLSGGERDRIASAVEVLREYSAVGAA